VATDMLMMLVQGDPISAECKASIDTTDKFMSGFMEGKYFEISDFDFGIDLVDDDTGSKDPKDKEKEKAGHGKKVSRWKTGAGQTLRPYEVNLDEINFTRQIDVASPKLFLNCFRSKSFDSAVIVKRKVGGTQTGIGFPFFRIDLNDVLLVSIDWEVDDVMVREKCKMVCREVGVKYRVQMPDGSRGAEIGTPLLSLLQRT
jgi:type VI protein secretion system component Hcp